MKWPFRMRVSGSVDWSLFWSWFSEICTVPFVVVVQSLVFYSFGLVFSEAPGLERVPVALGFSVVWVMARLILSQLAARFDDTPVVGDL